MPPRLEAAAVGVAGAVVVVAPQAPVGVVVLAPQVAVEVTYNRRIWSNFFVTHNRALTAADFDEVTLIAPTDDRLPNGGGYPVTFLTRNNRSALGATDSYYTTTDDFGGETHYWHGVDVTVNSRLQNGLTLQIGSSTGRAIVDNCEIVAKVPEMLNPALTNPSPFTANTYQQADSCRKVESWQTQRVVELGAGT